MFANLTYYEGLTLIVERSSTSLTTVLGGPGGGEGGGGVNPATGGRGGKGQRSKFDPFPVKGSVMQKAMFSSERMLGLIGGVGGCGDS